MTYTCSIMGLNYLSVYRYNLLINLICSYLVTYSSSSYHFSLSSSHISHSKITVLKISMENPLLFHSQILYIRILIYNHYSILHVHRIMYLLMLSQKAIQKKMVCFSTFYNILLNSHNLIFFSIYDKPF